MKGTLQPTVNTQRIKLRTFSSERRALTATPAPIMNSSKLILPATVPIAKKFKATRLLQKWKGKGGCGSNGNCACTNGNWATQAPYSETLKANQITTRYSAHCEKNVRTTKVRTSTIEKTKKKFYQVCYCILKKADTFLASSSGAVTVSIRPLRCRIERLILRWLKADSTCCAWTTKRCCVGKWFLVLSRKVRLVNQRVNSFML